jgi:NAD(P)-dependent dehydrogenase (short-subunit alcohol dehydrogenase family)
MGIGVVAATSSGIGYTTALHLARQGYRVFAIRNFKQRVFERFGIELK